jgi:hypothetical protein
LLTVFYSTRTLTTKTPLHPSIDRTAALELLHDHAAFQSLQPLFVSNRILESPPEALVNDATAAAPAGVKPVYCEVTIKVPMGPFSQTSTTPSAFIDTEDGLIIVYQAPMGICSGVDRFILISMEGGDGLTLLEESVITAFAPMMSFIAGTKKGSHTEVGASFGKKLLEKK